MLRYQNHFIRRPQKSLRYLLWVAGWPCERLGPCLWVRTPTRTRPSWAPHRRGPKRAGTARSLPRGTVDVRGLAAPHPYSTRGSVPLRGLLEGGFVRSLRQMWHASTSNNTHLKFSWGTKNQTLGAVCLRTCWVSCAPCCFSPSGFTYVENPLVVCFPLFHSPQLFRWRNLKWRRKCLRWFSLTAKNNYRIKI